MKNHLKRISAPKTWLINRKENTFILRPNPGSHSLDTGMPLGVVMRDLLNLASTMDEVKKILSNNNIAVDGKRRKDHRYLVGLFDVLSFPETKKYYRMSIDEKGRIIIIEIDEKESKLKLCKVVGKNAISGGKLQFHLHDGKNILSTQKAKVGDSLLISLPTLEVKEVMALQAGAEVILTKGNHGGDIGKLKEIKSKEAVYVSSTGKEIDTYKDYLFVLGKKESAITLR